MKCVLENIEGSIRILDIRYGHLLLLGSTSTVPGKIFIYEPLTEKVDVVSIKPIEENSRLKEIENDLEPSIIELNSKVHIVLLKPKRKGKIPLIIIPHGGPNSVYSVDYVLSPIIFASLGYAVASSKKLNS